MSGNTYLLLMSLVLTAIIGTLLSVRIIRRSHFKSLLAWHTLAFMPITAVSVVLIVYIDRLTGLMLPKSNEVTYNFIFAALLSYIFQILYLLYLEKKYRLGILFGGRQAAVPYLGALRRMHLFLFGCIIFGFTLYFNYESTLFSFDRIKDIFSLEGYGSYNTYYRYRAEMLFIIKSNLESHIEIITLNIILPLFNLYALFCWGIIKNKKWLFYWGFSLLIWIFYSLLTLQKGMVITIVISNVSLLYLMKGSINFMRWKRKRTGMVLFVALLIIFIFLIYYSLGFEGNILYEVLGRVFYEPGYCAYVHFLIFPEHHPFIYFNGSTTMNWLLGFGQATSLQTAYSSPAFITSKMLSGTAYSMNANILGDGWANYGFVGVIECSIILFGILMLWDIHLIKNKTNLPVFPLVAFFIGKMFNIINGDLFFMLTSGGIVFAPLIYLYIAGEKLNRRNVSMVLRHPGPEITVDSVRSGPPLRMD